MKNNSIPEQWLCWTYLQPALLKPVLHTTDHRSLRIIFPGERNFDNGPDMIGAVLELDGIRYRGDVEFHITLQDWYRHGHDEDLRYGNIILHVLWEHPESIPGSLQKRFSHLILSDHLTLSWSAWRSRMQALEAQYPQVFPSRGRITRMTADELQRLALRRFYRKVDRFQSWTNFFSLNDVVAIAFAEALGYSRNKYPFRQLLWECPPSKMNQVFSPLQRSPLLFWVYWATRGGLLNRQQFPRNPSPDRDNTFLKRVKHWYGEFQRQGYYPILRLRDWYFSRIRPVNHPYIRMAALAQILFRYQAPNFFQTLLTVAMQRLSLREFIAGVLGCLRLPLVRPLQYLLRELLNYRQVPPSTLGETRALQFLINALLPILYFWAGRTGNPGFQDYLLDIYFEMPAVEEYRFIHRYIRYLHDPAITIPLKKNACYQQGLLEFIASQGFL